MTDPFVWTARWFTTRLAFALGVLLFVEVVL